ncbi:MFS transporter [Shewanella sp.]|uniref:MFS transporter n=1 Tax=Shewanella sp. TaxID=50422 RepID=UPI004053F28E
MNDVNPRRLIWGLCIASVVIYINLYLMQGMLPSIAEHFKVSGANAALVLSATSFSLAFSLLMFALISDRVGRQGPIIITLWLLVSSNLLLILVQNFDDLVAIRLLQGVLLAGVPAIAMAYMKEQLSAVFILKAAAIYIMANSFGGILGRIVGGVLSQYFDWQQSMIILFIMTLLGVGLVQYLLRVKTWPLTSNRDASLKGLESTAEQLFSTQVSPNASQAALNPVATQVQGLSQKAKLAQDIAGFLYHLSDKQMRLAFIIGGLAFFVMVNQFSFIQLHLMAAPYGLSRFQATLIFLCYLSGTLTSYLSARWIAKFGSLPLFKLALGLMLLGSVLTLFNTLSMIVVGFLLTAAGFFLTHSCCNAFVAIRAQSHRAKATALYLCSYYLGAALGGPYLMVFWQQAQWPGVVLGSVVIMLLLLLAIVRLSKYQKCA